jgi:hypothetical protein
MDNRPAIIVFILFGFVLIGAVVIAGYLLLRGSLSPKPQPSPTPQPSITQLSYSVEGPVVANELYRSSTITITPQTRTLVIYQTYQNTPIVSETFPNNQTAFNQFLAAAATAGVARKASGDISGNPGGACPTGNKYIYETKNSTTTVSSLWASACSSPNQSFGGEIGTVNPLFRAQIPGIEQVTQYTPFM